MGYKNRTIAVIVSGIMLILLTIFTFIDFIKLPVHEIMEDKHSSYKLHYVMISDSTDKEFWNSVYESAINEAEKNDAYVEKMDVSPSGKYTMLDYLKISEASNVDGILICPDGSKEVSEKLNEIAKEGIPVVTLMQNVPDSNEICHIGINAYEIGQLYASIIAHEDFTRGKTVMILQDSQIEKSMLTTQIKTVLNQKFGRDLEIQSTTLQRNNEFEAEEIIRDIFLNSKKMPDILICLNETDSECASQAAVDYNMVGQVEIIGYYTSEAVLSSIKKGILDAAVGLDTKGIGESAVKALKEYKEVGYTNDYICTNLSLVDSDNISNYLETGESDGE